MKLIRMVIRSTDIADVRDALGALNIGRLSLVDLQERRTLVEVVVEDQTVVRAIQQLTRHIDHSPAAPRVVVVPLD
jgi:nitrogen regulatory protein PII